jgi:hypothetical protein
MGKKGSKASVAGPRGGATSGSTFDEFADDLLAERNVRPLVIVGASKVDHLLQAILEGYLLPKIAKQKDPDELLEGDRPLSTFSARIKLCYRLGLIDATLYAALEKLRAVRNPCAHHISFDPTKSPIREHLANLRAQVSPRSSFRLTRERYFEDGDLASIEDLQCVLLTLCVLLEAIRESMQVTLGNRSALRIAAG